MFSEEAVKKIEEAVELELAYSKKQHLEKFSSEHEAYAVSLEELEEAADELSWVRASLNRIWRGIREKNTDEIQAGAHVFDHNAVCLLREAVQLAAMARKFKELF